MRKLEEDRWMEGWRVWRKVVLVYLDRLRVVTPSVKYTHLTPALSSGLRERAGATLLLAVKNKLSSAKTGSDGRLTRDGGKWEGVIV